MFINYFVHKDECYVIYVSGNVFDCLSEDKSISSNEIIDNFCKDYESIHKVHLPIPNGPTNYRQLFLRAGGYDSEENLQKLIELIKDCNDTDFSMDELLKQTELEQA
jgi:hypothetical protein